MPTSSIETGPAAPGEYESKRAEVARWCEEHDLHQKETEWILGFLDRFRDASAHLEATKLALITPRGRKLTYELQH